MNYLWVIVGIVVLSVIITLLRTYTEKKDGEAQYQLEKEMNGIYSFYNGTLTLYKIDPRLRKILTLTPYAATTYKDIPEEYVYTGATVGGVTTGGVHKTGGYTESHNHSTKRYELKIREYNYQTETVQTRLVEKIYLADDHLRQKAQKHAVNKYLEGSNIIVKKEDTLDTASALFYQMGNQTQAVNSYTLANIDKYPAYEKGGEIINFVCGGKELQAQPQLNLSEKITAATLASVVITVIIGIISCIISLAKTGTIYWSVILTSCVIVWLVFAILFLFVL